MKRLLSCVSIVSLIFSFFSVSPAFAAEAVVHAVLFYSPACSHCHHVINDVLPPLFAKYGEQLEIVTVDVSQPEGQELFMDALQHFEVEYFGVPFLVIGDICLIGSLDIPEQLPGLIEQYLSQGGIDWPAVPGLAEAMLAARQAGEAQPARTIGIAATGQVTPYMNVLEASGVRGKFAQDPLGNSLAVLVLVGMVIVLGVSVLSFRRMPARSTLKEPNNALKNWLVPLLCFVGLGVAGYLAFVEMTRAQAVCGPVGDCNTVQQSEYAMLFGLIPIGLLGLVGYVLILVAWGIARFADQRLAAYASLAQLGMTAFGVVFSIYLTFLEPFVIGATCAWCLTSAVIMTALLGLSLFPARQAALSLQQAKKHTFRRSDARRALKSR